MIAFKTYAELLAEGGNAVDGVVGIYQENSIATVDKAMEQYAPLLKVIAIVSIAYPIVNVDGNQPNMIVQLDFMVVESVRYASWSYFSPSHLQSQLKGLYRNELNHAVAKYAGFNVSKQHPDTLQPIEWDRMWFDLKDGLHKGKQTLISPKTGKVVKTPSVVDKQHVSNDPDEIVRVMYGHKYKAEDILTFEQAFKVIMSTDFPHRKYRKEILQMTADGIKAKGYPVPEALAKEL